MKTDVEKLTLNYGTYVTTNGTIMESMVAVGRLTDNEIDVRFHRRIDKQERLDAGNTSLHKKFYYNMYPDMKAEGRWVIINLIKEVDTNDITIIVQDTTGQKVTGTDKGFGFNTIGDPIHTIKMNAFCGRQAFINMAEEQKQIRKKYAPKPVVKKLKVKTYQKFKVRDCRTAQ